MIIDIHTHAWPEKVSQKAREQLEASFKVKLIDNPTLDNLIRYMDKNGIDISAICAVASRPEQVRSINDWVFSVRGKRIRVFCALHPEYGLWKEELKRIKEKGDGVKFQPESQDFFVDDEKVYPIYEEMERLGIPAIFHCGEELSGTRQVHASPSRILKIKERFSRLTMIAAHFGGFRTWDESRKYLLGKDIYLDTSFFFHFLPEAQIRDMILSHRPDRLLFGTDFPLVDQGKDIDFLNRLEIPVQLKTGIFSSNAIALFGL